VVMVVVCGPTARLTYSRRTWMLWLGTLMGRPG
jgi:hypothetical protein